MKRYHAIGGVVGAVLCTLVLAFFTLNSTAAPIRIGVLHALTGTMANSEAPLVDALKFAAHEINQQGGLLGRTLEVVVADSRSDWEHSRKQALRLIKDEQVAALFGCWTSACRKAVLPVVEIHDHLLFYPLQYEGLESSPNLIYTGSAPNQQIIPAFQWAQENFGPKIYLVGSDYIFPRAANMILKDIAPLLNGQVVGERYLPLGSPDVDEIIADIRAKKPDIVLNSINGDSNLFFFRHWQKQASPANPIPILSFSVAEALGQHMPKALTGHYLAWSYFQEIQTPENKDFLHRFQRFHKSQQPDHPTHVMDDPMEATYIGLNLWAQGVRDAQSIHPKTVRQSLSRQSFAAPQGIVTIDPQTRHLWRNIRIGQFQPDGRVKVVWAQPRPIRPTPFPTFHTKSYWKKLLFKELGVKL
ncbi:urea ABC transporter substrate-binding protein [Magnetococcus sp. PR-3]|uniref:urea ABC transporter substrate-binding protein n=1 Tax=Magnetococcus sp. PR-3 TaxID=3120355 RepID=UPI002FCE4073